MQEQKSFAAVYTQDRKIENCLVGNPIRKKSVLDKYFFNLVNADIYSAEGKKRLQSLKKASVG